MGGDFHIVELIARLPVHVDVVVGQVAPCQANVHCKGHIVRVVHPEVAGDGGNGSKYRVEKYRIGRESQFLLCGIVAVALGAQGQYADGKAQKVCEMSENAHHRFKNFS